MKAFCTVHAKCRQRGAASCGDDSAQKRTILCISSGSLGLNGRLSDGTQGEPFDPNPVNEEVFQVFVVVAQPDVCRELRRAP